MRAGPSTACSVPWRRNVCGIVAAVAKRGGLSEEALGRATRRLRHRGPDAQRVWVAPDRRAALGHARLSIIDLLTGDQPIANEDGRVRLVVNGEFYDFERAQRDTTDYLVNVFFGQPDSGAFAEVGAQECRAVLPDYHGDRIAVLADDGPGRIHVAWAGTAYCDVTHTYPLS